MDDISLFTRCCAEVYVTGQFSFNKTAQSLIRSVAAFICDHSLLKNASA